MSFTLNSLKCFFATLCGFLSILCSSGFPGALCLPSVEFIKTRLNLYILVIWPPRMSCYLDLTADGLRDYLRLYFQRVLFPPPLFISFGFVTTPSKC